VVTGLCGGLEAADERLAPARTLLGPEVVDGGKEGSGWEGERGR
jgi:hypothetical protein